MRRLLLLLLPALVLAALPVSGRAADAPEPLPTAGDDHAAVVAALNALARGDSAPLTALPAHLLQQAPAVVDAADRALARRWTTVMPAALARLPATAKARVAAHLDERFLHAGSEAMPWDFLPAPAARTALARAADRAFDHGRLADFLLLARLLPDPPAANDPRVAAARALLGRDDGATMAPPALPQPGDGAPPAPPPCLLAHGDGWIIGLDPAGQVRWQRQIERLAHVALGDDGALVADTTGLAAIDGDGAATRLPPLPPFARPLALRGASAWFTTGATVWRLDLASGAAARLTLPEAPLGPPLLHGGDAWWLTRTLLLCTHGDRLVRRMPHLLALSTVATLEAHPRGAAVRDGARWWLVEALDAVPPLVRGESALLAGDRATAISAIAGLAGEDARALRVRITRADPRTDQECALVALATHPLALTGTAEQTDGLTGNPQLSEADTDLDLPVAAWPHQVTMATWTARHDGLAPEVRIRSDALSVQLEARWPGATDSDGQPARRWRRSWPTRPLLDAPSRAWAVIDGAVAVADGAGHLLVADLATGVRIAEADVPTDVDPAAVVRCGDHAAALLADLGRTLIVVEGATVRSVPLTKPGETLRARPGAVAVIGGGSESLIPLH